MENELVQAGIEVISKIQEKISLYIRYGPDVFDHLVPERMDTRIIDHAMELDAAVEFGRALDARLPGVPRLILGEEKFKRLPANGAELDLGRVESISSNLRVSEIQAGRIKDDGIVVLVDMVDGTDLVMRELSNWCSAVVFYRCDTGETLAAAVGDAFGRIFYATKSGSEAYVRVPEGEIRRVKGPSSVTELQRAAICFYGQKTGNFNSVVKGTSILEQLGRDGRIYNLGGHPMLVKVTEGQVDAVFELRGQKAHDCVAGLFIALKAGAIGGGPDGSDLDFSRPLLRPASNEARLAYVLAATRSLFESIRSCVLPRGGESTGR